MMEFLLSFAKCKGWHILNWPFKQNCGSCAVKTKTIKIKNDLAGPWKDFVLAHELIHMLQYEGRMPLCEAEATSLGLLISGCEEKDYPKGQKELIEKELRHGRCPGDCKRKE